MKPVLILFSLMTLTGNPVFAAENTMMKNGAKMTMQMTTDQRLKMASAHEKMATCLRSDRPLPECHQEMMSSCKVTMGENGCPMMGNKMDSISHHSMAE